ncbi:myb domain protein [Forsythia ovata]|uniref:Myb domain protein n=1 Tax=Forsythia ovata TaxID=205694 RepID=A0ABD1PLH4_9LAMI
MVYPLAKENCPMVYASAEENNPMISRPVAKVGAFNVYNSSHDSAFSRTIPMQGPLIQASKPDFGICKFLEGACGESIIPLHCGHGCCAASSGGSSVSTLLGPEFLEYKEISPFPSQELSAIAMDLNNIAWIRSGLENAGTEEMIRVGERLFGPYEWERFGLLPLQLQSHFLERESACSPNLTFNGENGWNLSRGTYDAYLFKR